MEDFDWDGELGEFKGEPLGMGEPKVPCIFCGRELSFYYLLMTHAHVCKVLREMEATDVSAETAASTPEHSGPSTQKRKRDQTSPHRDWRTIERHRYTAGGRAEASPVRGLDQNKIPYPEATEGMETTVCIRS